MTTLHVYTAINKVTAELAKVGISKDRRNQQQGYSFRGIDDIYSALATLLAENHLCIIPRVLSRECVERQTAKGGVLFYSTVFVEYDFVSAVDGSKHVASVYGEAMDSADKSTNKAMSAAYKYACLQAFCIPTEGDNDADAHTPQVAAYDAKQEADEFKRLLLSKATEGDVTKLWTDAKENVLKRIIQANGELYNDLLKVAREHKAELRTKELATD